VQQTSINARNAHFQELLNPEQNPQISNLYMFEYLKRRKSNNFQTFFLYFFKKGKKKAI